VTWSLGSISEDWRMRPKIIKYNRIKKEKGVSKIKRRRERDRSKIVFRERE
jgi:hypothetical protein